MVTIETDTLKVTINPKGAELNSIYNKPKALEYLWQADPVFWGKHSPVLFPIVGTLKEDTYLYDDKTFHLARHGFAREMIFSVVEQTSSTALFSLIANEETLQKYPFLFSFSITYTVTANRLDVTYGVLNKGDSTMYFSVGGHPAFKVPLAKNTSYHDYYLEFDQDEDAGIWPISKDGLIEQDPKPFLNNAHKIMLTKVLFHKDALVFKHLKSSIVKLNSDKTGEGFAFHYPGFPYLGIWAAKDADFVCIEPWCGIADSVTTEQDITQKEGIIALASKADFTRTWSVELF